MIEFVHESDYSSEHHCEVHERETNQKPRVASDFCNHATNRLGYFQYTLNMHTAHARAKNRLGPPLTSKSGFYTQVLVGRFTIIHLRRS